MLVALLGLAAAAAPGCLDVSSGDAPVSLVGRLERRTYTTPDVGSGRSERAYILLLDRPICIDDRGEFANPRTRFRQVHVYAGNDALQPRLRAAVGHRVQLSGTGFAAHNAHHHQPLVVDVRTLRVGRR